MVKSFKVFFFPHMELWTGVSSTFFKWETNHRVMELFNKNVRIRIMKSLNVRPREHGAVSKIYFLIYLKWSIFALQRCISFCCATMSQLYVYIYPLPLGPPPTPSHPSRSSQSADLSSPCYTASSH